MIMKIKTSLPPERQELFCRFTENVTQGCIGMTDRGLGAVFEFLRDAESVDRKGWKAYRKSHSARLSTSSHASSALYDFLAFCGIQAGSRRKKARKQLMEKRSDLSEKAQQMLNDFSEWLVKENAYSETTVRGYIFAVKNFLQYTTVVTTESVKSYSDTLESVGYKPSSINHHLNAVGALACMLGKHIEVKRIKVPKTLSLENVPTEREMKQLLDYCHDHCERLYIFIRILMTTGARRHEFLKMTYEMVADGRVDLKGKGGKVRRFFFSKNVRREVAAFASRNGLSGIICSNRYGSPMSDRGLQALLRHHGRKAGLRPEVLHCHAFRHYFAKMYVKRCKTKDVTELAELLGHSKLDTTAIYLQRSQKEQERLFNKNVDW